MRLEMSEGRVVAVGSHCVEIFHVITRRFTRYDQMCKQHIDEYLLGASENVLEIGYSGSKMSS